ncbi:ArsR/SmtB family transcription factor [Paenibacillus glycanilyticus]|uniref:Transcriptional regulator n=1 Tax=Paenibacillus glycanilyticus TaxID=126569 RepID=A0ABQ6GHH6_9BACL|nr:metalloregulator ArsR/SmtB family transcription factor [Paenibacillus glycanilyticus]GLX69725.1 transcriptional regulator [Paenibacillus glycanilyticus]
MLERKERLKNIAKEFRECKDALTAIGDETRQHIIMALIEGESECEEGIRVGELKLRTNLSRPAVSHHLKVLKDAQLIGMTRVGTMNYYYLDIVNSDIFKLKQLFDNITDFIHEYQQGIASDEGE